jgi:hypothetical protein
MGAHGHAGGSAPTECPHPDPPPKGEGEVQLPATFILFTRIEPTVFAP